MTMISKNVEIPCNVEFVLHKVVPIRLDECQSLVVDKDDCGNYEMDYDTRGVDWEEKYSEQHWTILDLINELKSYVNYDLAMTGLNTKKGKHLQRILKECEDWEEVQHTIEQA